jgi:hypothetical protein
MMPAHSSQAPAPRSSPTWVRRPVKAKKAGSSSTTTTPSMFARSSRAMRESCGTMTPRTKAPKMAWIPIASVTRADSSRATKATVITLWVTPR